MAGDHPHPDGTPLFDLHQGDTALVIAAPHVGTYLPPDIATRLNATGLKVGETDYHVHRLFDWARASGATTLFATHSRYVVDLNRDAAGGRLYPGRFETPICPVTDFDLNPLYLEGQEPTPKEIEARIELYWRPYHHQLRQALDRAHQRHGQALLIDAHSIRPVIPNLFEGRLTDLNFGTHDGRTLRPDLIRLIDEWRAQCVDSSHVRVGRFKGGYTTRHYGTPKAGIQALQIEIVQDCYLNTATPHLYEAGIAAPLSRALRPLVEGLLSALPT